MTNWTDCFDNDGVKDRLRAAIEDCERLHGAVPVSVARDIPENTVGVLDNGIIVSPDVHESMVEFGLSPIQPELN